MTDLYIKINIISSLEERYIIWIYSLLALAILFESLGLYSGICLKAEGLWKKLDKKCIGRIRRVSVILLASFLVIACLYMLLLKMGFLPFRP